MNPLIYVDLNDVIDEDRFLMSNKFTSRDLATAQVELQEGVILTLYGDCLEDGKRPYLIYVEAIIEKHPHDYFVAHIDRSTWRRQL